MINQYYTNIQIPVTSSGQGSTSTMSQRVGRSHIKVSSCHTGLSGNSLYIRKWRKQPAQPEVFNIVYQHSMYVFIGHTTELYHGTGHSRTLIFGTSTNPHVLVMGTMIMPAFNHESTRLSISHGNWCSRFWFPWDMEFWFPWCLISNWCSFSSSFSL